MNFRRPISAVPKLFKSIVGIKNERVTLVLQEFKSKMDWKNANKILDVGCGPADVTVNYLLSQAPEYVEMTAMDISPGMLELASKSYNDPRLKFILRDITDPKFGEDYKEYFNTVFSVYCLHHVQNQWQAMKNIYEVLRPGGETLFMFIASHPFFHIDEIIAKKEKWAPNMQHVKKTTSPYHNIENPVEKLKNLLLEVGFIIEDCYLSTQNERMPSREIFYEFSRGMSPHYSQIPHHLHEEYSEELKRELFSNSKLFAISNKTGEVFYSYTRLIGFAKKPAHIS